LTVARLNLGGISVDVVFKDIKNVHLSVYPPFGRVRIAAPTRMKLDTVRVFAISKLGWIKRQQKKLRAQERETPREYLDRESHYVWGKRYLLKGSEKDEVPTVTLKGNQMLLQVRPGTDALRRRELLEQWYREQIRDTLPELIAKWERRIGVKVARCFVQRMKTKWGSCNAGTQSIRLNTDLARKPRECLEYIVVHEMAHLLVRHHNEQFSMLMDRHLPNWRQLRLLLNSTPLAHTDWVY
jgi:predicted metal-dependent hydrolase